VIATFHGSYWCLKTVVVSSVARPTLDESVIGHCSPSTTERQVSGEILTDFEARPKVSYGRSAELKNSFGFDPVSDSFGI